jgi:hypothetical protein
VFVVAGCVLNTDYELKSGLIFEIDGRRALRRGEEQSSRKCLKSLPERPLRIRARDPVGDGSSTITS